jgi:hypothetical protein
MPTNRRRVRRRPMPTADHEIIRAYLEGRAPVGIAKDEAFMRLRLAYARGATEPERDYRRRLQAHLGG